MEQDPSITTCKKNPFRNTIYCFSKLAGGWAYFQASFEHLQGGVPPPTQPREELPNTKIGPSENISPTAIKSGAPDPRTYPKTELPEGVFKMPQIGSQSSSNP